MNIGRELICSPSIRDYSHLYIRAELRRIQTAICIKDSYFLTFLSVLIVVVNRFIYLFSLHFYISYGFIWFKLYLAVF